MIWFALFYVTVACLFAAAGGKATPHKSSQDVMESQATKIILMAAFWPLLLSFVFGHCRACSDCE